MAKDTSDALAIPTTFDTSKWAEEKTGFAPYWTPKAGASFIARVVAKEEGNEGGFTRFLLQAGQNMKCQRGPADAAEPVDVEKGEFFTISVYFAIQDLFDLYLESGLRPWMHVTSKEEVKTATPGRTVWQWQVKVSPDDKKKVDALRVQAPKAAKQLES